MYTYDAPHRAVKDRGCGGDRIAKSLRSLTVGTREGLENTERGARFFTAGTSCRAKLSVHTHTHIYILLYKDDSPAASIYILYGGGWAARAL